MRAYKDINIGDMYQPSIGGIEYVVLDKDDEEKMIKIVGIDKQGKSVGIYQDNSFYVKNTRSLFNRRVLVGR